MPHLPPRRRLAHGVVLALLGATLLGATPAAAAERTPPSYLPASVEIHEWPVPWEASRPRDPYVAPDGKVWFVGQRADYLARLDPESGRMERTELPEGTGPHNLIVGADGAVWYAGNRVASIGRLDPASGTLDTVPMPDPAARDPHTLAFGSSGEIWFTVQGGNLVGRLDPATRQVRLAAVPTPDARPYGIVVDAAGRPWFTLFGTNKLGVLDPESFTVTEVTLPRPEARPRRLVVTADQKVWYADYAGGHLGVYDPASEAFREWLVPGGADARPYAIAADDHGHVWFVETGPEPNRLQGFAPGPDQFFGTSPIPSGGGAVRHMVFHEPTRALWFGTDTNTLGRAGLP